MPEQQITVYRLATWVFGNQRERYSFTAEKWPHEDAILKTELAILESNVTSHIEGDFLILEGEGAVSAEIAWTMGRLSAAPTDTQLFVTGNGW